VAITSANARELQAKAVQSRREHAEERLKQVELHKLAEQLTEQPCDYVTAQIVRVRAHLTKIDDLMVKAVDPLDIDRLARARGQLSEQERILSGRPLPGARRPGKERTATEDDLRPL